MNSEHSERYERQIIVKGFGLEGQLKLRQAKVLVVGAGGLGCPALQYLAAAGVGTLGVIDHDTVSLNNLHRQLLYATEDVGSLKVEVAAAKLLLLNPEVKIHHYSKKLVKSNVLDLFSSYDYIVDGTDNFESRYLINDACSLLEKPLIYAAVSAYEGQVAVFNVADEHGSVTNYRDLFPISPLPEEIPNCAENGVIGVLPGIIGTMQAAEVIKLIAGFGKPLINILLTYNMLTQQIYEVNINAAPIGSYDKPNLMDYDSISENIREIDGQNLENIFSNGNAVILDVREFHETPKLQGKNYQQVPMSVLEEGLLAEISEKHIIMVCQHGIRSLNAAEFLQGHATNLQTLYSLKGGVVRWKDELKRLSILI